MEEIYKVVYAAIRKVKPSLTETELTPATRFAEYYISSIEMSMIIFEINDYFDIEIEPRLLMAVESIGDVCTQLQALMQSPATQPTMSDV